MYIHTSDVCSVINMHCCDAQSETGSGVYKQKLIVVFVVQREKENSSSKHTTHEKMEFSVFQPFQFLSPLNILIFC